MCHTISRFIVALCIFSGLEPYNLVRASEKGSCSASFESIVWSDVKKGAKPPEKEAKTAPDIGINPAKTPDVTIQPYSAAGKFLSSVGKERRYCVAQFVDKDILITAAHCVRDKDGTWINEFDFQPSFSGTGAVNVAKCFISPTTWVTGASNDFRWQSDYSFVVLDRELSDVYLEIDSAPSAKDDIVEVIGFPLQIDGGAQMKFVLGKMYVATELGRISHAGESTGLVVHAEHRFGLGVSGGGWVSSPSMPTSSHRHRLLGLNATGTFGTSFGARADACMLQALKLARERCSGR